MPKTATCRICGCTEDHAYEGGCHWVQDPEGLGDLCNQCLERLGAAPPLANGDNHVWEIPLEQIRPAPWNPPSRMDPDRVRELADSMRIEGQQSPALIRPVEAEPPVRFELVWGHRRYAALQLLAGQTFTHPPAIDDPNKNCSSCGVDLHGRLPREIADRPKMQIDEAEA